MGYHLWLFQIQYSAAFWSLVSVFISLSDVLDLVCSNAFGSISGELWRSWVKWSSRQKMASASSGGAMRSHAEPDHLITVEWSCESFPGIFQAGYGSITIHTIFRGMNIHLPAILMFTRGTRFWHTASSCQQRSWLRGSAESIKQTYMIFVTWLIGNN